MNFFEELKRRNVVKVAVLYLIASWLLLQVTDVLSSLLSVPEWAGSLVVMLLILGFFPTLIFSWVYEMTPEGLKREKDVDHDSAEMIASGIKINKVIAVLLALAIVVVGLDRLPIVREAAVAVPHRVGVLAHDERPISLAGLRPADDLLDLRVHGTDHVGVSGYQLDVLTVPVTHAEPAVKAENINTDGNGKLFPGFT